ncbi:hypothetical protein L208DRAFT_1014815, partial [Tricholoma matsutake]
HSLAKNITKEAGDAMGFRFKYKKQNSCGNESIRVYTFYCAQLSGEQTKHKLNEDTRKQHVHMTMEHFDCNGCMHIMLDDEDLEMAVICMMHYQCHHPYLNISILPEIAQEIERLKDLSAAKV